MWTTTPEFPKLEGIAWPIGMIYIPQFWDRVSVFNDVPSEVHTAMRKIVYSGDLIISDDIEALCYFYNLNDTWWYGLLYLPLEFNEYDIRLAVIASIQNGGGSLELNQVRLEIVYND